MCALYPRFYQADDWAPSFDDHDSAFWEDHLGGPDDPPTNEAYDEMISSSHESDECSDDLEFYDRLASESERTDDAPTRPRRHEIVTWLQQSGLAQALNESADFFVAHGIHVRLRDGSVLEVLDWLRDERICDGTFISGFAVNSHSDSDNGVGLYFRKRIVDAPFMPLPKECEDCACEFELEDPPF